MWNGHSSFYHTTRLDAGVPACATFISLISSWTTVSEPLNDVPGCTYQAYDPRGSDFVLAGDCGSLCPKHQPWGDITGVGSSFLHWPQLSISLCYGRRAASQTSSAATTQWWPGECCIWWGWRPFWIDIATVIMRGLRNIWQCLPELARRGT